MRSQSIGRSGIYIDSPAVPRKVVVEVEVEVDVDDGGTYAPRRTAESGSELRRIGDLGTSPAAASSGTSRHPHTHNVARVSVSTAGNTTVASMSTMPADNQHHSAAATATSERNSRFRWCVSTLSMLTLRDAANDDQTSCKAIATRTETDLNLHLNLAAPRPPPSPPTSLQPLLVLSVSRKAQSGKRTHRGNHVWRDSCY